MANGRFLNYQGGILITAIFTIGLLSTFLFFLIGNYRNAVEFSTRTRRYYEMRIMTELFLKDYSEITHGTTSGSAHYNTGDIQYIMQDNQLIVTAFAGKYKQVYREILKNNTENISIDTELNRKNEKNGNKEITDEN